MASNKKRNLKENKAPKPFNPSKFCLDIIVEQADKVYESFLRQREEKRIDVCKTEVKKDLLNFSVTMSGMSQLSNICFTKGIINRIAFDEHEPDVFEEDNWSRKIIKRIKERTPQRNMSCQMNKQGSSMSNSKLSVYSKRKQKINRAMKKYLLIDFNKTKVSTISKEEAKMREAKVVLKPVKPKKRKYKIVSLLACF